jgi:hypothetical protein
MVRVYFTALVLVVGASSASAQGTIGRTSSPGYVAPIIQSPAAPNNGEGPNVPPVQQLLPDVGAPGYVRQVPPASPPPRR